MKYLYVRIFENGVAIDVRFTSLSRRAGVASSLPLWIRRHFLPLRFPRRERILLSVREIFEHVPCGRDPLDFVSDFFVLAAAESILDSEAAY